MDRKKIQRIKFIIAIITVLIVSAIVAFRIIKYQNEGEKNMPFNISKIIILSTAIKEDIPATEGAENQNNSVWNFNIIQNNDIYISIENNKENNKKNNKIKNITISNIQILEAPKKGELKVYMPNSAEGDRYNYIDDYIVSPSLTYRGASENDYKNLLINNNGGNVSISFTNKGLGTYTSSEEDTEITFNGTMLSKLGLTNDDVKSKVSFDLIIKLEDGKEYLGNIVLDIDCNELIENGKTINEITDFSNVIFKRI